MKLLGREIARRTSLILGILVIFALTAVAFGVYALISDGSESAQSQPPTAEAERINLSVPKPSGPALSSEDLPETVSLPDSQVIDIALGEAHTCALHQDTTVSCWGSNEFGEIGAGLDDDIVGTPTKVKTKDSSENLVNLTDVKAISGEGRVTCALHNNTTVSCWGRNSHPQTNQGPECSNIATSGHIGTYNGNCAGKILISETEKLDNVIQISVGGSRSCALLIDGDISCWNTGISQNTFIQNLANGSTYLKTVPDISDATAITTGDSHACAIHRDTTVSCWGNGSYGRLGDGVEDTLYSSGFAMSRFVNSPTKTKKLDENNNLINLSNVQSISANRLHTCAIHTDESLSCWGVNGYDLDSEFSLDIPPSQSSIYHSAQKITLKDTENNIINTISSVTVGENHRCAIGKVQTKLYCWDINSSGQLGNGAYKYGVPTFLNAVIHSDGYELTQVSKVATGNRHNCAIHGQNNILSCWGSGSHRQLSEFPVHSRIGRTMTGLDFRNSESVSTGTSFTCLIEGPSNSLKCFGRGDSGQLGNGELGHSSTPVAVITSSNTPLTDVTAISAGDKYACAIHGTNAEVSCWGTNDSNALSSIPDSSISRAIEIGIQGATSISVGYNHACAVHDRDKTSCWGDDTYGQLGNNDIMADFTQVTAGYAHSCGIHIDGTASCWGLDDGRLGHADEISFEAISTPVKVEGLSNVESISVGHSHTCAVWGTDKKVSCWGSNNLSQLGNPDISEFSSVPIGVLNEAGNPLVSAKQISAGESTACAVFEDSRISCWGNGAYGKLLDLNPNSNISYAVILSALNLYLETRFEIMGQQIFVGGNHICLMIDSASLKCWGSNYFGEIGSSGAGGGGSSAAVYVNF